MDFTIAQQLTGPPDAVLRALLDPAFVEARAALPRLGDATLVAGSIDGTRARQQVRLRFTGDLSSAVTAVIDRDRLTWVDDATYDLTAHRAEHVIRPDSYGDRLSCTYVASVTADDAGSRRVLDGRVEVRMPLVGGRVERAIVSGFREYAAAEAVLLDDWLQR